MRSVIIVCPFKVIGVRSLSRVINSLPSRSVACDEPLHTVIALSLFPLLYRLFQLAPFVLPSSAFYSYSCSRFVLFDDVYPMFYLLLIVELDRRLLRGVVYLRRTCILYGKYGAHLL